MPPSAPADIVAGGVVVRSKGDVLLVHRPKYDDWSFPKGKLDRGEQITACAVREVREETGVDVRLGAPLSAQTYPVGKRTKVVHYWAGRVVGERSVADYAANHEIDQVRWVPPDEAAGMLTHPHDRDTLAEALDLPARTRLLVVLRHARARSRSHWRAEDRFRPLLKTGEAQAERVADLLAAYDVRHLVSSSSSRCVQTLLPYADRTARPVVPLAGLSEEAATPEFVLSTLDRLTRDRKRAVLCTHRPVLPDVFAALGLPDPGLAPGGLVVVHHHDGSVLRTEHHQIH